MSWTVAHSQESHTDGAQLLRSMVSYVLVVTWLLPYPRHCSTMGVASLIPAAAVQERGSLSMRD